MGADLLVADSAIVAALVRVEVALVAAAARAGIVPTDAADAVAASLNGLGIEASTLASQASVGGNPVIPLVPLLRAEVARHSPDAAQCVHRGPTSQDVLDTALMLVAADAVDQIRRDLAKAAARVGEMADRHRGTVMVGRTLTQHATPTTFGAVAAQWALALADAVVALDRVRGELPVQLGGASGTLASFVALGGSDAAARLPQLLAEELGLAAVPTWHVRRTPVTRLGNALVEAVDAAAFIGSQVAVLARPEIAEVAEGTGGGSSTMPQKQNPVASILLRSLGQRAPGLAAELHRSAALAVDQRPDGAWHAEWPALRELLRLALGAGDRVVALVVGLQVDSDRMAHTLADAGPAILSERVSLVAGSDAAAELIAAAQSGRVPDVDPALLDPAGYLGLAEQLVDQALAAVAALDIAGEASR